MIKHFPAPGYYAERWTREGSLASYIDRRVFGPQHLEARVLSMIRKNLEHYGRVGDDAVQACDRSVPDAIKREHRLRDRAHVHCGRVLRHRRMDLETPGFHQQSALTSFICVFYCRWACSFWLCVTAD